MKAANAGSVPQMWSVFWKAKDLRQRLWFALSLLIVYRFCTYVPVPGVNPQVIGDIARQNSGGLLGMLDMFSGGSLGRMSIMTLNLMPYISASIIVQLLTAVVPSLEALKKEGELGRMRLNQLTRYGAILLASFQGYAVALILERTDGAVVDPGIFFRMVTVITLLGATLFLMWMGEQISSRGIGNGSSLIIYTGIVANLPQSALRMLEFGRTGAISLGVLFAVFVGMIAVVMFVVFVERAHRKIFIQYPRRQSERGMQGGNTSHVPIKVNTTGVIPPIFANSLLALPITLLGFLSSRPGIWGEWASYGMRYISHGTVGYMIVSSALIIFFAFFYTSIVFNTKEMTDNLKKHGAFVLGYKPGAMTERYFDFVINRLTVVGSVYLAFLCIIPELVMSRVTLSFYFGGTSLLILVGVALDTIGQVHSALITHQYEHLFKKRKR